MDQLNDNSFSADTDREFVDINYDAFKLNQDKDIKKVGSPTTSR